MWPTYFIPYPITDDPPPPGYYDNGCGYEAPFSPDNIPNLRVGDFMLWILVTNVGRTWSHTAALTVPTGWNVFAGDPGRRNWNNSGALLLYKLATADDLNPATTYVSSFVDNPISTGKPYRVCSVTYAYRNIHPNMPFGSRNTSRASSSSDWRQTEALFMRVGHDQSPVVLVAGSRTGNSAPDEWGLQSTHALGPAMNDEVRYCLDYEVDVGNNTFYAGRRIASITEGENWIPGETPTSSMQDGGWTMTGMTSKAMYGYHVRLKPGGFSGARHYVEYEVALTEGETYTFHFSRRGPWNVSHEGAVGLSYVDPSSNERGRIFHNSVNSGGDLDPLSDYGTVWRTRNLAEREDGVPSTTGSTPVLTFTAQETGVHKLRISVVQGYYNGSSYVYNWSFTPSSWETREVRGVCFRRGNNPAYFLPTPGGAITAGDETNGALGSCWSQFAFNNTGVTCPGGVSNHLALSLNRNVPLVPAVMENAWNWGDTAGLVDRYTVFPTHVTSDDAIASAQSSRPVMPRIDGVLQKYYFEATLLNAKNLMIGVSLGSFGGGAGYWYDSRSGRGYIPNADASWSAVGTPVTPVIGDVWGCMVNYVDKEVEFFRNGVSVGVIAMLDTYGVANSTASGKTGWDWPVYAVVHNDVPKWPPQIAHLSVNLAGPFAYQPSGTVAFDWAAG